ncbi:MAG TPA: Ig-like domain-containing protein [Steroidobacteraceae bacterium]|nr:Ig-like domain-containing protein [Steroidobacteraceae bacterium]
MRKTTVVGLARCCGLAVMALLAACGGGGGGKKHSPPSASPPVLKPQTITFEGGGGFFERRLEHGDFTKAATGYSGTGAITYSSSDPLVATVDPATGAVTLVGAGQTDIKAKIAADANYQAAEATYVLTVPRPEGIPFDALIGADGAQVTFPAWARGHEFLRSSQAGCDVTQINMCVDHQVDALTELERQVFDTTATTARTGMWWLQRPGTAAAPLALSHEKFFARSGAALAGFHGKLWLIGGHDSYDILNADIWNSADGVFWTRITFEGGFAPRRRARLLAFADRLWLIGGNGAKPDQPAAPLADVWSSADGIEWRLDTANAPFGGRFDHGAVVFDDRMWVIGGTTASGRANDVWWSTNGVDWTEASHAAAFSARAGHTVSVMDGRLWVVAGDDGALRADVWSSEDGVAWTRATNAAGFTPRARHVAASIGGQLCVTGGVETTPTISRILWCSSDGANWSATLSIGFNQRYDVGSAQLGDRWYFVAGEVKPGTALPQGGVDYFYTDDVHSWDGLNYRRHTPYPSHFSGTPNVLVMNDRLYMIGSFDGVRAEEFTYVSDDGTHWQLAPGTIGSQPNGRIGSGFVVHGGKMWVIGGGVKNDDPYWEGFEAFATGDVASSSDGGRWDFVSWGGPGERFRHAVVSFKNKMFAIGGTDGLFELDDVRSSSDGVQWDLVTTAAAFGPRYGHRVVVFNGRMWLYGGTDGVQRFSDAWSSDDGVNWQQESTFIPYVDRLGMSMVVHDGRVWMMGGRYYEPTFRAYTYQSEIFVSDDGAHFSRVDYQSRIFSARSDAAFVSAQGKLWVIGGQDRFSRRNDVWSSEDGIHWKLHVSALMPYPE